MSIRSGVALVRWSVRNRFLLWFHVLSVLICFSVWVWVLLDWYFFSVVYIGVCSCSPANWLNLGWNLLFFFSSEKKIVDFLYEERSFERRMKLLVQLFPFLCKVPSVRIFRSLFKLSLLCKCIILGSFYTSLVCIEINWCWYTLFFFCFVCRFTFACGLCVYRVSLIRILCSLLWTFIHKNIWIFFFHLPQNNI